MKKVFVVLLVIALFVSIYQKNTPTQMGKNSSTVETVPTEKTVTKSPLIVKVKKGEGLWQVAMREMGSGYKWVEVAQANGIKKPYTLVVDQELKIPGKEVETVMDSDVSYTIAQVTEHADKNSCWIAIDNKVYDVTPYISSGFHPGKAAILQGCGKDATTLFNTRPMGSGTSHSDRARKMLPKYLIGKLEG